jgi:DNA-directed RNA polymerase specialized sigma24 family protein
MALHSNSSDPSRCGTFSDATWENLYTTLRSPVRRWVYTSGISSWLGQEEDITEEIVQESISRTFERSLRLHDSEETVLRSPEAMAYTIARNYYNDLRRREGRIDRFGTDENAYRNIAGADLIELALEGMYQQWILERAAYEISTFPEKQRRALLVDLAKHTDFDEPPTALQQVLLTVDIRLQDYRQSRLADQVMRSRHAALLSVAYRRLREAHVDTSGTRVA